MDTLLMHVSEVPITSGSPYADTLRADWFVGKHEARLAKAVGLTQFGVNLVTLDPGALSSLRHWHEAEDEFVYVISGQLTLIDENGAHELIAGSFAGFPAGQANGHHLENRSQAPASFLVTGSRRSGEDVVHYPDDDLGPIRR